MHIHAFKSVMVLGYQPSEPFTFVQGAEASFHTGQRHRKTVGSPTESRLPHVCMSRTNNEWHITHLMGSSHHSIADKQQHASSMYLAPENRCIGCVSCESTKSVTIPKVNAVMYAPTHSTVAGSADRIGYVNSEEISRAIGIARNAITPMHIKQA
jgi:hypothetical protein